MQRILPDQEFWENALSVTTEFFSKCILPQTIGKYYTCPGCEAQAIPSSSTSSGDEEEEGPWCYCRQDLESSTLIGCDNDLCPVLHSLSKCKLNFMVVCHACSYIFVND